MQVSALLDALLARADAVRAVAVRAFGHIAGVVLVAEDFEVQLGRVADRKLFVVPVERSVVQEIAKKAFAITTVLDGVEDVRVPNFVSVERRNQSGFRFHLAESEIAPVLEFRCRQAFS